MGLSVNSRLIRIPNASCFIGQDLQCKTINYKYFINDINATASRMYLKRVKGILC